jgi:type I restriction enzyme S subunit
MSKLSFMEKLLDGAETELKVLDEISIKISSGGTPRTGVSEYYDGDILWLRTQEVDFDDIWDTGRCRLSFEETRTRQRIRRFPCYRIVS